MSGRAGATLDLAAGSLLFCLKFCQRAAPSEPRTGLATVSSTSLKAEKDDFAADMVDRQEGGFQEVGVFYVTVYYADWGCVMNPCCGNSQNQSESSFNLVSIGSHATTATLLSAINRPLEKEATLIECGRCHFSKSCNQTKPGVRDHKTVCNVCIEAVQEGCRKAAFLIVGS